jgi:hypothetical protein
MTKPIVHAVSSEVQAMLQSKYKWVAVSEWKVPYILNTIASERRELVGKIVPVDNGTLGVRLYCTISGDIEWAGHEMWLNGVSATLTSLGEDKLR